MNEEQDGLSMLSSSYTDVDDDEIAFDYIKGSDFKMIWADGAVGGLTPSGNVHLVFFSERGAIPRREVFKIDWDEGDLGEQVREKTVSRNSIVREMSCDLIMQPNVAKALVEWLTEHLEKTGSD